MKLFLTFFICFIVAKLPSLVDVFFDVWDEMEVGGEVITSVQVVAVSLLLLLFSSSLLVWQSHRLEANKQVVNNVRQNFQRHLNMAKELSRHRSGLLQKCLVLIFQLKIQFSFVFWLLVRFFKFFWKPSSITHFHFFLSKNPLHNTMEKKETFQAQTSWKF